MSKLHNKYTRNFTVVPNSVIRDERLSYKARGIFLYLASLPDQWEISLRDIKNHSKKDGAVSVRTGVKELEDYGYLCYERRRGTSGTFLDVDWHLTDGRDKPGLENPTLVNTTLENPTVESPTTLKYYQDPSTILSNTIQRNTQVLKPPKPPQTLPAVAHTYAETPEHLGNGLSQGESCKDAAKPAKKPPTKMATWDADPLPGSPVALGKRSPRDYTPGFLAWWGAYPTDRRISKLECFKVWKQQNLEPRTAELVEKLERLKETTWKDCEPKYIKTALPYLNSGRYDDDLVSFPHDIAYDTAVADVERLEREGFFDEQERNVTPQSVTSRIGKNIQGRVDR